MLDLGRGRLGVNQPLLSEITLRSAWLGRRSIVVLRPESELDIPPAASPSVAPQKGSHRAARVSKRQATEPFTLAPVWLWLKPGLTSEISFPVAGKLADPLHDCRGSVGNLAQRVKNSGLRPQASTSESDYNGDLNLS